MTEENWKKQVAEWQIAADSGDGLAKYNLGICYLEGNCVERDEHLAYELLTEACALLDPEEQREELGYAYFNLAMTAAYLSYITEIAADLRKAIDCGYTRAYTNLLDAVSPLDNFDADMLAETREKYPQGAKALEGLAYLFGMRGYAKDEERGITLLSEAADEGESYAVDTLLKHLLTEWQINGKDYIGQIEYLIPKASERMAAYGYMTAGVGLLAGIGGQQDVEKSFKMLSIAMDDYHYPPAAMAALTICNELAQRGMELDNDFVEMCMKLIKEYPELLDRSENVGIDLFVADAYEFGKFGMQQDAQKALDLYRKAQTLFEPIRAHWASKIGKQQLSTMLKENQKYLKMGLKQTNTKIQTGIRRTSKLLNV